MEYLLKSYQEFVNENLYEVEMVGAPFDMSEFPEIHYKQITKIAHLINDGYKKELSKYKIAFKTIIELSKKNKPAKKGYANNSSGCY